jgi:hypothetical protein
VFDAVIKIMERAKFRQHLENSLPILFDLTKQHCFNRLAENCKFIIEPTGTDFHNGLVDAELQALSALLQKSNQLLDTDQVLDLLWRDNQVPLWINITVYESKPDLTIIHLLCSRRRRPDEALYHKAVQYPPFHVLVPIPPGALHKEGSEKFDINWKKQLDDVRKPINFLIKWIKRLTNKC